MIRLQREIWLCLHLPKLALEVFADCDSQPLAVIERQRVHCGNAPQLEPGLAVATAQALCAGLRLVERQPQRETETLHALAHWAYQFTPTVGVAEDNSLLLEIGGCRRLHQGLDKLLQRLRDELEARGHHSLFGLAHTRKAAWLLARTGAEPALSGDRLDAQRLEQQLGAAPVNRLPLPGQTGVALARMGITTLTELQTLPQAALGKRFGADCVRYLQQLWGRFPDPQPAFTPTPSFRRGVSFIDGVHNRQMLLFPMKHLVQALCDYLSARQLHCRALHWQLCDARGPQAEMSIELAAAQNRWRTFLELSQLKLDSLPLRDAVYTLRLGCDSFSVAAPGTLNLFDDPDTSLDNGSALLDRLRARLGPAALQRLEAPAAHWPEAAWRVPAAHEQCVNAAPPTAPRPLWLLPKPSALRRHDRQLLWDTNTPLELLRGPERIGNHWWQNTSQERDYYIARHRDGLCWIFRERGSGAWFVHGLFA